MTLPSVTFAEFSGTGVKLLDANQYSFSHANQDTVKANAKLYADFQARVFVLVIPDKPTRYVPFECSTGFELLHE